ncbi:MAG: hypothetical protein JWR80_7356 [Bradyrhizobium sp.]|nr:hypothetical protein [Bradyrhizobium sp.]
MVTAALNAAIAISAGFHALPIIVVGAWLFVAILVGRAILGRLPISLPAEMRSPSELLLGLSLIGSAMVLVSILGKVSAGPSFAICCGAGVLASLALGRGRPYSSGWTNISLLYLATICLFALVWSWQAINAVPRLRADGTFPAWIDFFAHAGYVAQFAHLDALRDSSIFVQGERLAVYHYGSYMLPAAVAAISGLDALTLATTLWPMLGFVFMGLGAAAVGAAMGGSFGGFAALAGVFLLPDAPNYWIHNTFFGFYWLLQISASAYGVGVALLAIAFGTLALRGSRGAFWISVATGIMTLLFRAHIFVILALTAIPVIFFNWRPQQPALRWICLGLLVPLGVFGVMLAERVQRAPHFLTGEIDALWMLKSLLTRSVIDPGLFEWLSLHSIPTMLIVAIGLFLLFISAFGALLPVYFAELAVTGRKALAADWIPLFLLLTYGLVVVVFPKDDGEFQHRPFVLVYASLAIWCCTLGLRTMRALLPRYGISILVAACAALLAYPFFAARYVQVAGNEWAPGTYVNFKVPRGLLESADYIRRNAAGGDVIWVDKGDPWAVVTGLSERTSFLALDPFYVRQSGAIRDLANTRIGISNDLRSEQSLTRFLDLAASAGINWCILSPDFPLPESFLGRIAFSDQNYRVLRVFNAAISGS